MYFLLNPMKNRNTAGFVYLRFDNTESAASAQRALHGRWFAGKMITATFMVLSLSALRLFQWLKDGLINEWGIWMILRCPKTTSQSSLRAVTVIKVLVELR